MSPAFAASRLGAGRLRKRCNIYPRPYPSVPKLSAGEKIPRDCRHHSVRTDMACSQRLRVILALCRPETEAPQQSLDDRQPFYVNITRVCTMQDTVVQVQIENTDHVFSDVFVAESPPLDILDDPLRQRKAHASINPERRCCFLHPICTIAPIGTRMPTTPCGAGGPSTQSHRPLKLVPH